MSKRRVVAPVGSSSIPFSRQRDCFIEVLSGDPGSAFARNKWPSGKARIHADGLLELGDLARPIACALIETAEVEGSLVAVGMQFDLLLIFRDGTRDVALLLGEQRQIEVREPDVGLLLDRRANLALGSDEVAARAARGRRARCVPQPASARARAPASARFALRRACRCR